LSQQSIRYNQNADSNQLPEAKDSDGPM